MNRFAIALAVAAVSASTAAAQSNRKPTWDDLAKPYEAKTNPAVPLAPPQAAITIPTQPSTNSDSSLVDGCVHQALAVVPKVEGARVASTKPEFSHSASPYGTTLDFYNILVTIEFNGRPVHYSYGCRVTPTNGTAELLTRRR